MVRILGQVFIDHLKMLNLLKAALLDEKCKFSYPSDRVKCLDVHPKEPWILATLYIGHVHIYNYDTQV